MPRRVVYRKWHWGASGYGGGARATAKDRGREGRILLFRRVSRELRIAPRGVALFMAAIDHRPAKQDRREHPTNRHMTTVFILKSPTSTYDALILIVSLALATVSPSSSLSSTERIFWSKNARRAASAR